MDKQEYDKGYQEAIETIKSALNGKSSSGQGTKQLDPDMETPPQHPNRDQQTNKDQHNQQGGKSDDQSNNHQGQKNSGNQGVVRPEDCIGPDQLNKVPAKEGAMIDKNTGDKIAGQEGYAKEGGGQDAVEREWKDAAIKAASKMKGDAMGNLKSKILSAYRTSTDWKKELRTIVGHSISPEDKRQAYANKNILISQDRIARTDKDKYDNVDYIMVWIDSSGSMSDDQLRLCLSEVYTMALKKKPLKVITVQCDTKIQEIKEYRTLREMQRDFKQATVKGRGGTDLKPCWSLLKIDPKYKRIKPELVMIFTDGYLDQYKRDPRNIRNLCWCIIDNPGFNLEYKDMNTKVIYLNSEDIK